MSRYARLGEAGNSLLTVGTTYESDKEAVDALSYLYRGCLAETEKVIFGQEHALKMVLISLFSNGHSLLVGVPGLAKTLLVQTVASVLDLEFKRIQFTPDLMPSDITGSEVLGDERSFKFIKGPVFANVILADEINRTPPKTQAALLEAMQERTVTVGGVVNPLPAPFFVLATQNPIEQEGTYVLPEAQLDRFMFQIMLDYPSFEDELRVVKSHSGQSVSLTHLLDKEQITYFQSLVKRIPVTDNVLRYAVRMVSASRPSSDHANKETKRLVNWGAGPRASQYLIRAAQCHAAFLGKYTADKEDVQAVALAVLRHRIVLNYQAEADGVTIESFVRSLF